MKKAIKTSLLAAAVVASFGASATLTLTTTAKNVGVEGTKGGFVEVGALTATATANAAYNNLDQIKINLTGGEFDLSTRLKEANAVKINGVSLVVNTDYTLTYNSTTEAVLKLVDSSATVKTARTALAAGSTIVIGDGIVRVVGSAIADKSKTEVAITTVSNVGGQAIETAKATALNGVTQLSAKVTKFSEAIDVSQGKNYFAGGTKDASTTASISLESAAVGANAVKDNGEATVTLKGDFSFLDADNDGKLDTGTKIDATGTTTVAKDFKSITTKVTPGFGAAGGAAAAGSSKVDFTITTDGKREIPVQDFTVEASYNYVGSSTLIAGTFSQAATSAGSWTLNGSSPRIPYMPFGAGISQIVYVTNNGKVDGAVSFTAYDEAGTKYTGTLDVVAKANAVTQLSQALRNGLTAAGFSGTGKLRIDLTINSPSGDLQVFAAYNVRGDRLAVGIFN